MNSGSLTYKESAAAYLSWDRFSWKEIALHGSSGFSSNETGSEGQAFAGGFHYRGSALVSTSCRNRSILWHCENGALQLLEVSMDTNLAHNALRLVLKDGGFFLPDVCVHELSSSHIVLLFASATTVFRLVLPHPETVLKDPSLAVVGEGLQPSIFAFASTESFRGSNSAAIFSESSSVVPVTSCSSWISVSGLTTFALPSPSQTILVVQLPPPGSHSLPIRSELKETSVMHRLWTTFLPSSMRGGGESEDYPENVVLHTFSGETIIISLYRDLTLRLWSCQQAQCLMTHKLQDYVKVEVDQIKVEKLLLRKASGGTSTSLRFGIYLGIDKAPQVSLFQLLLMDNQLVLNHLSDYPSPRGCTLVDFCPTNREVWGVWRRRGGEGGEETLVQCATYDGEREGSWRRVLLATLPAREVVIPPYKDPREAYLDELFTPGRFSSLAISKALELYGAVVKEGGGPLLPRLRGEVVARVEQELHVSAGSHELQLEEYRTLQTKCWAKFYGCCHEYQGLLSHPVGLFSDPSTGLVCLIRRGMLSPLHPVHPIETFRTCPQGLEGTGTMTHDHVLAKDVATFVDCVKLVVDQLSPEVLDSFLADLSNHDNDPSILAMELASLSLHRLTEAKLETLHSRLRDNMMGIRDISAVMDFLRCSLDPSDWDTESGEEMEEEGPAETDLQLAVSQLFAAHVAMVTLGSALREACLSRLQFCRDVLVLLCVVKSEGMEELHSTLDEDHAPTFSSLVQSYHSLHWLTTQPTSHATVTAFESNLKQLAALEISTSNRSTQSSAAGASSTLCELYLCSQGGRELRSALVRGHVLPTGVPLYPHWANIVPRITTILMKQLWPSTASVSVCEFLLAHCQYIPLQEYVSKVGMFDFGCYSREFLLGQSYLNLGEVYKARDCFLQAAQGVGDPSESLLQRITSRTTSEGESGSVGSGGRLVQYYVKVMRLFEHVSAPTLVVSIVTTATEITDKADPNCAILWVNLFKYQLELGHYDKAYNAILGILDPSMRRDCLHRFIVVLTEHRKLKQLCGFPYTGMEEEVEKLIEARARSVDILKHSYYDLLYCFHTIRENYRKAAYVMYEYGLRLGREVPGPKSLQKQANCYCMTLSSLNLVDSKYAWVIKPVEMETIEPRGKKTSRRKRVHPLQQGSHSQRVAVLTIEDIEKEYLLVKAKLHLLQKEPSMSTQLSSPFVSAEEVVSLLVQVGLFDRAIDTALRFKLHLEPIFEALAARCVHLSVNVVAFRRGVSDTSTLDWLGMNTSTDVTIATENSLADRAWSLLKTHLENHDPSPTEGYHLQKCVARKLLSMGAQLPQWIIKKYKETNPAELLRLYLTFDLLEQAAQLSLEYIDAVVGHGKEFYGLETALHGSSPSVWLPYSALDHLHLALQGAPTDSTLNVFSRKLEAKMERYFHLVSSVSSDMEQEAHYRYRQPDSL